MITHNPKRLQQARQMVAEFRAAGRAPAGRPGAKASAAAQVSPAGWPVTRDGLAAQLDARLAGRDMPAQVSTSYCGCAAFLYCVLEDRPDLYAGYALALWLGRPFSFRSARERLTVDVHETTKQSLATIRASNPRGGAISDLDWMTMASLSGATRYIATMGPSGATPTDQAGAITWPWMMRRWFAAVGSHPKIDSVGVGLAQKSTSQLVELLALWGKHWLVLQIDPSLLNGGGTSIQQRHWVVVDPHTRPLVKLGPGGSVVDAAALPEALRAGAANAARQAGDAYGAAGAIANYNASVEGFVTNLKLVTWGKEHFPIPKSTLGYIASRFHGGYAFPRFPA